MFCSHSIIPFCKSSDHFTNMTSPLILSDPSTNSRQNHHFHRNRKQPNSQNPLKIPPCDQCRTAAVDVVILIAVIGACGLLIFPYLRLLFHVIVGISGVTLSVIKEEVCRAPMIYAAIGFGFTFATLGVCGIFRCTSRKCGNPNCRDLRNAAEFDIQLETEECVKNSNSYVEKDGGGKGFFEFAQDRHRELKAELRKVAPLNGRAVLVFRARCGCSVGRMEVPGPKKLRKIKK